MNSYNLIVQSSNLKISHIKYLSSIFKSSSFECINENAFRFRNVICNNFTRNCIASWSNKVAVDTSFIPINSSFKNCKILAIDMDSTLINIECINEIARFLGVEKEVSEITSAAMNGQIKSFQDSLKKRVSLLKGGDFSILERVYNERLRLNPGGKKLILSAKNMGIKTLLISSGFTFFSNRLNQSLKFDACYANKLEIRNGRITGRIEEPILDAEAKSNYLLNFAKKNRISTEEIIAIGDGANDLKMLESVGFSIAYHAKPIVSRKAKYCLNFSNLDGVLNYFQ